MKSKKFVCAMLALILALGAVMTACGGKAAKKTEAAPTGEEGQEQKLTILGYYLTEIEEPCVNAVLQGFTEKYGIEVETEFKGEYQETAGFLTQAKLAQKNVDIVLSTVSQLRAVYAPNSAVMDITSVVEPIKDRFRDGVLVPYTINDRIWGIPVTELAADSVYYNKTLFDELGLSEPETFEDVVKIADTIKEKTDIKNPWIQCGKTDTYWMMWFTEAYSQVTGNNAVARAEDWLKGNGSFHNDETLEALSAIKAYMDKGVLTMDSMDTDYDGMFPSFVQQQCAMIMDASWSYSYIEDMVGDAFEVGVFKWPSITDKGKQQPGGAPDTCVMVAQNYDPAHTDAIVKFIDYVTSPEVANIWQEGAGYPISVFKDAAGGTYPLSAEIAENGNYTCIFLDNIYPAEITVAFNENMTNMMSGRITPEELTDAVQTVYENMVKNDGYKYNWYDELSVADYEALTFRAN